MFLVQRNPAKLWPIKTCAFPIENTNEGAQSLWNTELYLKGAAVITPCSRLCCTCICIKLQLINVFGPLHVLL